MGSRGGFTLLMYMLVLAVLCHLGNSLTCYACTEPEGSCSKTTTCLVNLDTCLFTKAEPPKFYQQC
uniref:Uncharacterized protein n=2 Tax=Canis lupus familiaris TaxID=9615 RepID=A0A8C0TK34_CANLF